MSRFTMFGQMPDPVLPPENLNPSFDQRARMAEAIVPAVVQYYGGTVGSPGLFTEQIAAMTVMVSDAMFDELKRTHPKA